jgi:hypothetical protein
MIALNNSLTVLAGISQIMDIIKELKQGYRIGDVLVIQSRYQI